MKNKEILLEARHITKIYGKGEGQTVALDDVSLNIYNGELLVILGSSGSGKSTLLNMIGGLDKPDKGEIFLGGADICRYGDDRLTEYRRKKTGFVFQSFNLISELTARENVALTSSSKELTEEMLRRVGISEKGNHYPSQLSGGEQQRVSIARALAKEPEILFCDEPTGALDYETGKKVLCELEAISRTYGKTVVLVTHTKEIGEIADRVIRMRNGKITEERIIESPVPVSEIDW